MEIKVIAVAGGSGSGKTTLAKKLIAKLEPGTSVLSMDDYYLPVSAQQVDANGYHNFDLPTALDLVKFKNDLQHLKAGKSLSIPAYDFNDPTAAPREIKIEPKAYVVTEGIFILQKSAVIQLIDEIIFVETDQDIMLKRRLKRDTEVRKIKREMVQYQWDNHFMPAFTSYILPSQKLAHITINGNVPFNIEEIAAQVQ